MSIVFVCIEFLSASDTLCVCIEKILFGFIQSLNIFSFNDIELERENSQHQRKCEPKIAKIRHEKRLRVARRLFPVYQFVKYYDKEVLLEFCVSFRFLQWFYWFYVNLVGLFVCIDATVWQRKTAIFNRFHSLRIRI